MVTDKEIKDAFNEYMIKAHDIELDLYRKEILYARHEKIEMDEQPFNYGFQAGAKWMQEKMKEENEQLMKLVRIGASLSKAILEEDAEL